MKFRTFKFHLEQGIRGLFKNGIMSLASIGIVGACIFIVIISLCVAINIDSILQQIENNIGIEIFFGNEATEEQIAKLEEDIKQQPHVTEVVYNTYDDALDTAKEWLGTDSLESFRNDNPLPRSFSISLDGVRYQKDFINYLENLQISFEKDLLKSLKDAETLQEETATVSDDETVVDEETSVLEETTIDTHETESLNTEITTVAETKPAIEFGADGYVYRGIEKILHAQGATSTLVAIDTVVRVVSVILVLLLCIVSVGIIMNTIKLTVFIRKNEISIMKYVGATDWFIRWPFIIEGLIIGVLGAVFPCAICWYSYDKMVDVIYNQASIIKRLFQFVSGEEIFIIVVPVSLLIGALLGAIGSINSIRKHLNV